MKPKKLDKKLSLKKTTVSNLNNSEMGAVVGGLTGACTHYEGCTDYPCNSCDFCSNNPSCATVIYSCTPDWTNSCM